MSPSWSSTPLTLDRILTAMPPDLSGEKLRTYHRIAFNIDNIAQLLQHSPGPGCPSLTGERHIPGAGCPSPDVPLPRAAILPLIEQTLDLSRTWRAQHAGAIEILNDIEASMTSLREYAGDNMVALELSLLKAAEQNAIARPLSMTPDADAKHNFEYSVSHDPMPSPPGTLPEIAPQGELTWKRLSTITSPDISISIPRTSTSRGMNKRKLKQLLEKDMMDQGIHALIQRCSYRGKSTHVFVRFSTVEDAAKVRLSWKPTLFGDGAFIKKTRSLRRPLLPSSEAEVEAGGKSQASPPTKPKPRHVTVILPENANANARLKKINEFKLKALIESDLKDQGINVLLDKCRKSHASTRIHVSTTTAEDAPLLWAWKPNLPKYFGHPGAVKVVR